MRIEELQRIARRRRLDEVLVTDQSDIYAFTGVSCDSAVLTCDALYTDFRYVPMVHRVAPELKVRDIRRLSPNGERIGFVSSVSHARYLQFVKSAPRKAKFVDIAKDISAVRAIKTPDEIDRIRCAERMSVAVWSASSKMFTKGMSERLMANMIRSAMFSVGGEEAFETIVCIGANAAECHHVPDGTVWDGVEPVLVDMGIKLKGYCSDLTRNVVPKKPTAKYREVYNLVREANRTAIAAARPGMTGRQLDKIARDVIKRGGYGKFFGHSLGHGVGIDVHESPSASKRSEDILKPGMLVTVEPGIYIEGELGVRIEDLILITENGCEVLSVDI